ncbi:hypothetical protein DRE_04886 [Drechslerella stenobrocha 248]|uniref:3-oxo-5-alpha-steroid 4-dehydrogenase C-terminal domain-containing protein n=1 Tax=Drechslerella stenobrocha 248 TaxID=1043628 RepID=W7HRP9_9PEZI|nr:hypothetical protein DRE_04886 [Drechslerella stenobrocha 248]
MATTQAVEYLRGVIFAPDATIWRAHVRLFHFFPVVCVLQALITTPMGKTSIKSRLNLPGKVSWILMELVSPVSFFLTLFLNVTHPLAALHALPMLHKVLVGLYVVHYTNRALISPLRAPAYAPAHIIVLFAGTLFNYLNGYGLAGWLLLQHGQVEAVDARGVVRFTVGVLLWAVGFAGNIWHEDVLYEIRRRVKRRETDAAARKKSDEEVKSDAEGEGRLAVRAANGHIYEVPQGGLYEYCWHPHYFMEWVEWAGFLIAAGWCPPAVNFLVNEVALMTPRAFQGVEFYRARFGRRTPRRKAVVPFLL